MKIDKGEKFRMKSDETFHTIIARFVRNASHLYFLLGQSKDHKPIEEYNCYFFFIFPIKGHVFTHTTSSFSCLIMLMLMLIVPFHRALISHFFICNDIMMYDFNL